MAQEYGLTVDTSSLISSGTEREDTDDEICSFDLGPEPNRIPSDDWLDDHQQGLVPGSSEPRQDYPEYQPKFKVMPNKPSILDMMRNDIEMNETVPPQSPERAPTPTMGYPYDYPMDEPPVIQRITEPPRHSTPYPEPPTLSAHPRPASHLPRPRVSSVPATPNPAKRMPLHYRPVIEVVTPPITPPRAHAVEDIAEDTPSPIQKPGRSRGRGTWRAPQKIAPGVGTRSIVNPDLRN